MDAVPLRQVVVVTAPKLPPVTPGSLDSLLGPFYDTASVQAHLGGVSRQAVASRRANGTVLAVKTAGGRWVYPTFQFVAGGVDPSLTGVIGALRGAPRWSAALWLVTDNPDLDDMSPLAWVRARRAPHVVVNNARRAAGEWR